MASLRRLLHFIVFEMDKVKDSSEFISSLSKDVSISSDGVKGLAEHLFETMLDKDYLPFEAWRSHELSPKYEIMGEEKTLNWIFVIDTLNYCFWYESENQRYTVEYEGKLYTGYWSLCAAVNRALNEGIDITDPVFMRDLTLEKAKHIFRGHKNTQIPLLEQRVYVLNEAGTVLLNNFDGSVVKLIQSCDKLAEKVVSTLVSHFTSYNDESSFENRKVQIYKRAQIFVADVWACFGGQGFGDFTDINNVTMFADYRVPQALVYFGVLKYSDALVEQLHTNPHLEKGSREEIEIRGNSIWSVELVMKEMKHLYAKSTCAKKDMLINSIVIDFYLWDYAKDHGEAMKDIPIHKTRTFFY